MIDLKKKTAIFSSYLLFCFNFNIKFNKSKQYPNFLIAALAFKCIK